MKKKKNKSINYLKLGILLVGISLLLWNCENEADFITQEPQVQNSLQVKQSTFEEMIQDLSFKSTFEKFEEEKDKYDRKQLNAKTSKPQNNELYDFKIIKKKINIIKKDSLTSYTFGVKRQDYSTDFFENLILSVNKSGKVKSYLVRYVYDKNSTLKPLKEGFSFKGTIKTLKLDFNKIKFQGKYQEDCIDNFLMLCSGGTNSSCNGTPHIPAGICFDSFQHCFGDTYVGRTCTGSFSSDGGIPYDTSSTHNTSGGGGTNTNNATTTPVVYPCGDEIHGCDKMPWKKLADKLNITNQAQINYLESKPTLVDKINTFLDNNNSTEAENFAEEIIKAKESNNYTDLFNLTLFTQNPYNVWKSLSQAEKDLIKQNWSEAYHIFKNRKVAEDATKQKFNKNGLNDKSDAFRHAYYNIINTKVVGINMAKLFSDAHESETPSALIKEKEMDLFNNNVGQQSLLGNSNLSLTQLADLIYQKILNGNLRYLKPIDYNDPNFIYTHGITINTLLIPTNQ